MAQHGTIWISGRTPPVQYEGKAASGQTLLPGYAIRETALGEFTAGNATAVPGLLRVVNVQDDVQPAGGGDTGDPLTDPITAGQQFKYFAPSAGDRITMKVAAAAAAIAFGVPLELAADGTVKVVATGTPVVYAREAVDNSGGGAEVFIEVEVIR